MTEVESSMNFFDHIKELRQKLIYVIIFFIIAFIVSFYFSQSNQDGDWRIVQATDGSTKVLRFEQKVSGTYEAKQIFEG